MQYRWRRRAGLKSSRGRRDVLWEVGMPESLLSPSQVKLFGREFRDLNLRPFIGLSGLNAEQEDSAEKQIDADAPGAFDKLCDAVLKPTNVSTDKEARARVLATLRESALAAQLAELALTGYVFAGPP